MKTSLDARLAQSRPLVGTADAQGEAALIQGASDSEVLRMRAITPLASFLDFLM